MGTKELSNREAWQEESTAKATISENLFYEVFRKEFEGSDFKIHQKPKDFSDIYSKTLLNEDILKSIYNPPKIGNWGLVPDFAIENIKTNKILYGDNKRQDGWVEGGTSTDGRGNAHERFGRYFTPGLLKSLREKGKLDDNVLPFWIVFEGNITRDPKRVREIVHMFAEQDSHFFLWQDVSNSDKIIAHFNNKLKPLLL